MAPYRSHAWRAGIDTSGKGPRYFCVCSRCGADDRVTGGLHAPPWYTDLPPCDGD